MRIGLMLRSLDEKGGVGVYARNVVPELLDRDPDTHFVLLYRGDAYLGAFAGRSNVTERALWAPNKLLWDQVAVPRACRRESVDVLFHPKFSVPLLASCKTVMVLHGAGWFIPEVRRFWSRTELLYARIMMPLYCRKADAVISVSEITTDVFNRVLGIRPGKIRTVHFGPGRAFRRVTEGEELERVRRKYDLPAPFVLALSGYDRGSRKNMGAILEAYRRHHGKTPHKLVVCGEGCHRFRQDYAIAQDGYGADVVFPGWVAQEDLPVFYSLADVFLHPSNMEAHPIPITEAMACGTPLITSNVYGTKEVAGDAALFVDPRDPDQIASALALVLGDPSLRASLSARGQERAKLFSWERSGRRTLDILKAVGSGSS